jgi:hypothetical protein
LETGPPFRLILHWKRLALYTAPKPYYFGTKDPNVSAVFTTALLDLASVCSTRATAPKPPATYQRLSA